MREILASRTISASRLVHRGADLDVFKFRENIARDYERFSRSFTKIRAPDIKGLVDREYAAERFWPAPLVQLNPNFVPGGHD